MSGAVRVDLDSAGGKLLTGSGDVFVESHASVRVGDRVKSHGLHINPTMKEGSSNVFINSIPACRRGDRATCNHVATGSSTVFIN